MIHKDKLWIKFDELDIECLCGYNDRKCSKESRENCHLYLAKFIQLSDEEKHEEHRGVVSDASRVLERKMTREKDKFTSELNRSIRKLKNFRI